jgi:hypothetical protein
MNPLFAETGSLIVAEYLPGEEFIIDCFSHRALGLLYCAGSAVFAPAMAYL